MTEDRTLTPPSRRGMLGGLTGLAALGATGLRAQGAAPPLPKSPVALNVIDVGAALALLQRPIENYRKAKPELVSRISFTKAPAPELPSKLKAQQNAGRVDIDVMLGGLDALSAGIDQGLWVELLPRFSSVLPKGGDVLLEPAQAMQGLAQGFGQCVVYYPSGPLLEYMPNRVKQVPASAEELLAWCRQNPNRFFHARPANSGPGRTWLMALPYLLGDANPKDPMKGWDKTWAYLKELNQYVEYYPSGTGATMKELGEGSRDIIVTTTGWDINPRALGIVPKEARVASLKGFHWVADAQYMAIPKGVSDDKLAVLLDLIAWCLTPKSQAYTYDQGYFYPGPAVKGVTLAMAPQDSRDAIAEFGRPEYERLIADNPIETPLDPNTMVLAFRRWDEEIGGGKRKG